GQIDLRLLAEFLDDEVDDPVVEVDAAQERVAARREHLHHVPMQLQDADVERAAAQVVDQDSMVEAAVQTVRKRRRGRLVDDALALETGEPPCFLYRLPLVVV